ncbi:MAG: DUF5131 family protein [Dehalococcoidia bacterium]
MNKTLIEWVKNPDGSQGYTWNPITGCLNHVNGLCKGGGFPCYAHRLAHGRLRTRYTLGGVLAPSSDVWNAAVTDPFYPRFWEERLEDIKPSGAWWDSLSGRKPKGIFVCDMGELFGDWVPEEWQQEIFDYITSDPMDRFYLLTKQPQNLITWSFPENCWVGVTATDTLHFIDAHNWLHEVDAKVKFISVEPLLDWDGEVFRAIEYSISDRPVDWIIIGQQTPVRKATTPKVEWITEIVEAADQASVPVFLKDNLGESPDIAGYYPFYCDATGFPLHHLRQEMPKGGKEGEYETR